MDWSIKVTYETEYDKIRTLVESYGFVVDTRERLFKEPVLYANADKANVSDEKLSELEKLVREIPGTDFGLQNEYRI